MKRTTLSRAALPASVVLAFGLAACGASNEPSESEPGADGEETTTVSGDLSGAGASSQGSAMEAWIAEFGTENPEANVAYDPVGSSGGREQFLAGGVQFAGSDAYLDDEELAAVEEACAGGELIELPNYISPIAIVFNLEGVETLNLTPAVMAGIFDRQITSWDAPEIAADNPDATLPATPITPVNRSDGSGTTENFMEYLTATAADVWTYEPSDEWPVAGGEAANGTSGVIGAVSGGEGTIGYADASQAGDLGVANVQVGEEFVSYSPEAAAAVVEASERVADRGEYDYAIDLARDTTEAGTYPIVLVSYHLACSVYEDQEQADLVKAFLTYVVSEEGQAASAENAGSAPISDTSREAAMTAIDAISAG